MSDQKHLTINVIHMLKVTQSKTERLKSKATATSSKLSQENQTTVYSNYTFKSLIDWIVYSNSLILWFGIYLAFILSYWWFLCCFLLKSSAKTEVTSRNPHQQRMTAYRGRCISSVITGHFFWSFTHYPLCLSMYIET